MSTLPAYAVLLWASLNEFTGRISFEREDRIKHFFLGKGIIYGTRSNLVSEGLDMVLKQGFLTSEELLELQSYAEESAREEDWEIVVIQTLLEQKRLNAQQIQSALALKLEERVYNILGWFQGHYELKEGETITEPFEDSPTFFLKELFSRVEAFLLFGDPIFVMQDPENPFLPKGKLSTDGGAKTLSLLSAQKATGKLLFERKKSRKLFQWQEGKITSVASSDPAETLSSALKQWRYLSPKQIKKAEKISRTQKIRLRDVIRKEEFLSEPELAHAVNIVHTERILEAFAWRSGKYEFRGRLYRKETLPSAQTSSIYYPPPTVSLSGMERKNTEKGFLTAHSELQATAKNLDELCAIKRENSVLLTGISKSTHLQSIANQLASIWKNSGKRVLVIDMEKDPNKNMNFSLETQKYDRVILISDLPALDSPLPSAVAHVVLVIRESATKKEDVAKAVANLSPTQKLAGFLFQRSFISKKYPQIKKLFSY